MGTTSSSRSGRLGAWSRCRSACTSGFARRARAFRARSAGAEAGCSEPQKLRRLHLVVRDSRFVILRDWQATPNLASQQQLPLTLGSRGAILSHEARIGPSGMRTGLGRSSLQAAEMGTYTPAAGPRTSVPVRLRDRSSGHPVIRSSGHPVIRSSGHPVIRSSGHPVIRSSGHPVIRSLMRLRRS